MMNFIKKIILTIFASFILVLVLVSCNKKEIFVYDEDLEMTISHRNENYVISKDDKLEIIEYLNDMEFKQNDEYETMAGYKYVIRYNNLSICLSSSAYYHNNDTAYASTDKDAYNKLMVLIDELYIKLNGSSIVS